MTPSTCTINSSAGTDNSSGFGADSDQIAALPLGDVLNLDVVIDTAALTVEFLEVVLSLPVTMQCPFTLQFH